jgi:hypothetical protein
MNFVQQNSFYRRIRLSVGFIVGNIPNRTFGQNQASSGSRNLSRGPWDVPW